MATIGHIWPSDETSCPFSVALKANLLFDVRLNQWVLSQTHLCLSFHTWHPESLLQNIQANLHQRACLWLGYETCLTWHQICLNPNLQVDKVGWSNRTILCFLLSSFTLFQYWKESLYPRWCHIWCCCCQRLNFFCWLMHLFLSNSGNLTSCIMKTSFDLRQPVRVLTSLVSPSNFVIMPFGRANLLINSSLSQRVLKRVFDFLLCQLYQQYKWSRAILFRNHDLWPMVIESKRVSFNLIAFVFKGCECIPSRGIGVVGERYVLCWEGWVFHQTHCVFFIPKSYFTITIHKRFLRVNKNI